MTTTLLLVHGRSQASDDEVARDPAWLEAYVRAKKRSWLGGLAKGLLAAGRQPVDEAAAVFPFYGNDFADAIKAYEAGGGRRPELEILADAAAPDDAALVDTKAATLLDAATALGFDPAKELSYSDPDVGGSVAARDPEQELGWGDALRLPVLRSALQFVSRKTGAPTLIIERFLDDVAYYLELPDMRETVLGVVERGLREAVPDGGDVVVIGHSLGSIVAYDAMTRLPDRYRVRLLVTAGSPLGYPIVQKNLLGKQAGQPPSIPAPVPRQPGGWLNAYDELDIVALVHPLAGTYAEAVGGQLSDERTHNPTAPHSIEDYLSDPDVAGPIGRALA
jgi:hypothetical protein